MKRKLIKKYLTGDLIAYDPALTQFYLTQRESIAKAAEKYYEEHPEERGKKRFGLFAYLPLPDKSAWGGREYIINANTEEELQPGDYVLARNGRIVWKNSLDWLDYLAELNLILPGKDLPELHVEYNKDSNKTNTYWGNNWDEYNKAKTDAPTATTSLWEQIKQLEDEEKQGQTDTGHLIWLHGKDQEARDKTPGVGMLFGVPAALGVGATMFLADPIPFLASLPAAKIGEETLNYPFLQYGYKSFGDWWLGREAPETAKEVMNLGTLLGGGLGWKVGKDYLDSVEKVANRYAKSKITNTAKDKIFNTAVSFPRLIEDITAVELSSSIPKSTSIMRRPGVLYSKAGEANKGSIISKIKDGISSIFKQDPVWNLMEKAGIPEEQRRSVELSLFGRKTLPLGSMWTDPMTGEKYPIIAPNMTDEEIILTFAKGMQSQIKRIKSPEFKTLLLKEMGWGDTEYNEFILEVDNRLRDGHSVIVKGIDELLLGFIANTHIKEDGSVIYTINRDRIGATAYPTLEDLMADGSHEFYHGLTGGIRGTNVLQNPTQTMLANKYPRIALVMDHNADILKKFLFNEWVNYFTNTPILKIIEDLQLAGFTKKQIEEAVEINIPRAKRFKKYLNVNLETAARSTTSKNYNTHDSDDLIQFYTPESINLYSGSLLSKVGDVNKGSAVGAYRRPILRKNMHEFSDAEWDAAYEAALEKGNKREMWRLLNLRFELKAREFIANGGGRPLLLYRGDWRDYLNFKNNGVWLSSDPLYSLNFTEDRIAKDHIFQPSKVHKYFVKGTSELLLPSSIRKDLSANAAPSDYSWNVISEDLMFGVPNRLIRFARWTDALNNLARLFNSPPKLLTAPQKKAHRLGSADVIIGHDAPVRGGLGYDHWHPSLGIEYYVSNPKYVKSANLITYDDNGNMIPLSLRFNFSRNDRRYSWVLPLLPFLYQYKKDQAE